MSNLVEHARRELELIGEEPETIEGYLKVVQAFADMGHSGGSMEIAITILHQLFQMNNLGELTDDPDEWYYHGQDGNGDFWQNNRNGAAFSNDGGKTYYLITDGASELRPRPVHKSRPSKKVDI